jgi:hypothetical protein
MGEKKVFTIQQEVTRLKKWTKKIIKNESKALCKIGQEFYAF